MEVLKRHDEDELTVVSRRLLRVTTAEWGSPKEQFQRLQGSAVDMLLSVAALAPRKPGLDLRVLLLLDCMLRVVGEPALASTLAFATPRFKTLQQWFYGALGSAKFINVARATRLSWAESFFRLIDRLSTVTQVAKLEHRQDYRTPIPDSFIRSFDELHLDSAEVLNLRPYLLRTKTGLDYNVLLADMVPTLGRSFTAAFHDGLCVIARPKAKDAALRDFGTTFARFVAYLHALGRDVSPEHLLEPTYVQTFLIDFMEYHFMKMTRRCDPVQEATLPSLQKLWSRYRTYWHSLVRQGILGRPVSAFPAGNPKLVSDGAVAHRRVAMSADGATMVVTQKLLVPVPLHVTDEEATQLLFKRLRNDFSAVQSWLRGHLHGWLADFDRGCSLVEAVKVLPPLDVLSRVTKKDWKEPSGVALALKYFKQEYGGYVDTSSIRTVVYPNLAARDGPPKQTVSRLLGLPTQRDAMALMGFLASSDGRFSEAALAALVLLDINARRVNAVETDAGLTLTVLKERDAGDGWHSVQLNGEAATYVRRWIQLTEPLRSHMRKLDMPGWRNLFIYVGQPLGAPGHFNRSTNIHSAFRSFALSNEPMPGSLAHQVTIPRIRSTRGVLVFLETMDLAAMARELGNTNETSLRHYLPDSLWDYFATRWLRIFQNLLIVEATRDTPYMQRALRFGSAAEMDEFLRHHAVTPLVPVENAPSVPETTQNHLSELMVPASIGLFTMLLSISAASDKVEGEGRQVAPQALYWTEFTRRLKAYIDSDEFHDRGVKRMMATARTKIEPSNFAGIVCA